MMLYCHWTLIVIEYINSVHRIEVQGLDEVVNANIQGYHAHTYKQSSSRGRMGLDDTAMQSPILKPLSHVILNKTLDPRQRLNNRFKRETR